MKINALKCPLVNQNGYHKNTLTKERIGTLFIYPIDFTPDDCLACDGYLLDIIDYEDLYKVIGTKFNQEGDAAGKFRIPDYNVTGRFLQPGANVGTQIAAGLPNITGIKPDWITNAGYSGSFYYTSTTSHGTANAALSNPSTIATGFNASRCSAIYGNSATVQPPAQIVHICIKYK